MEIQIKLNKASKVDYAYLKDRILINQSQQQIYGTQCRLNGKTYRWELLPLKDPSNVNAFRKSMGLEPLADYLGRMN